MSLQIALQNQTTSDTVYAYITGTAIDNNNALFILQADGVTPYYPSSPSSTVQPLQENVSIPLGPPGSTVYATIPHLAGARLWFSIDQPLDFYLNPGPGLVEPSAANPSDSNINKNWAFCEFTFNSAQLYANITYVDFISIPIALTLTNASGQTQHVSGLPSDGFSQILSALQAQGAADGQPWGNLLFNNLRILSPNSYIGQNPGAFDGYYSDYVNQAWQQYAGSPVTVDTQAEWGVVQGQTANNTLDFGSGGAFAQPSSADIFSNSTGPFAGGPNVTAEQLNIGARLAAALNRSTLLSVSSQPDGGSPSEYYQTNPTNHYARVLHQTNLDGRGYAFPYDDVAGPNGGDQSGFLSDGSPQLWTVAVGGANATTDTNTVSESQKTLIATAGKLAGLSVPKQLEQAKNAQSADPKAPTVAPVGTSAPDSKPTNDPTKPADQKAPETPRKTGLRAKVTSMFASCFSKRR